MLDKLRNILLYILLLSSCSNTALDKGQVDDVIYQSNTLMIEKKFFQAERLLEGLLGNDNLTKSQRINVLYSLLELSYINKNPKSTKYYGYTLLSFLEGDIERLELKERLLYRLCESEDWVITRELFTDICM